MLRCNACIRRCIRAVFSDVLNTPRLPTVIGPFSTSKASLRTPPWQRRRYATAATAVQELSQRTDAPPPYQVRSRRNEFVGKDEEFKRTELEQELRYLKDPAKLADHTVSLLRQDDHDKALEIVRMGSKRMACTVSWNHLVDYEMSKGRVNKAMKLYNEMKKRAQPPDAHTYTIVLRGLAWNPHYQLSVSRAITVYHSMYAANCPVKPSIIHTNAVLKVCALAEDMDALWGVAAKLPTRGKAAPNNLSFTTILNAIRTVAWHDSSRYNKEVDETSDQKNARRRQAVLQGRRMWDEIVERWRSGDIVMDEEMVCSMGRLLLLGFDKRNYEDVLSLLEQTMAIPRPDTYFNEPARQKPQNVTETPGSQEPNDIGAPSEPEATLQLSPSISQAASPPSPLNEDDDAESDYIPGGEFAPLPSSTTKNLSYARPGRNTLSLAIDACLRLHTTRAAQDYWGLLTSPSGPYDIAPDSENYHMYLRLLRLQRASRLAVELVKEMKEGVGGGRRDMVQAKTFRIAMSCCVRDHMNRNSVVHAQELVRIMSNTLEKPDVKALGMFLSVTYSSRDWRAILMSLRSIGNIFTNLRSLVAFGGKEEVSWRDKHEAIAFGRRMVGCYDHAMGLGKEDMTRVERAIAMEQRNNAAAWVNRQAERAMGITRKESDQKEKAGNRDTEAESEGIKQPQDQENQPAGFGTTKHTHLPRGRKSWETYARDQPEGQRFERDDSDERHSALSDSDPEPLERNLTPLQGKGWQRWSNELSSGRWDGRLGTGHRRRRKERMETGREGEDGRL